MIIIRIIGGLGNQMFQFALYQNLKSKYQNVKCDIYGYERYTLHEGFALEKVFNIETDKATLSEVELVTNLHKTDVFSKFIRKVIGNKSTHLTENNFNWDILNSANNLYLDGYWQSPKYFGHSEQLRKAFIFNQKSDTKSLETEGMINSTNSVSLHVRRGDYVGNNVYTHLDEKYYTNAIGWIQDRVKDAVFFIFSDDVNRVKENLNFQSRIKSEIIFVENIPGPGNDMRMMAMCKHNIIANSSFSWWSAWLNKNESKIVVAPKQWYNNPTKNFNQIEEIPSTWIKI